MKISVIIPIGRRDGYQRCKASIDRSICAAGTHFAKWEIIEVFDDQHCGVAWARNEGLSRATGDWIAWVDSDDEVAVDWAARIASAIATDSSDSPLDIVTFDVCAEWDDGRGGYDLVYGRERGRIPAETFASDVIGVGRIGSWLWNKVFRRSLFAGKSFVGGSFEDYRMMCDILPMACGVEYIPEKLYLYRRSSAGLSQYVSRSLSLEGLRGLVDIARDRSDSYQRLMCRGVAVQAADFCRHAGGDEKLRVFIRRQIFNVLCASDISFKVKVKCLIEALKP